MDKSEWKETALWAAGCAVLGIAYHWLLNSPPSAVKRRRLAKEGRIVREGAPIVVPRPTEVTMPGGTIEDEMRAGAPTRRGEGSGTEARFGP